MAPGGASLAVEVEVAWGPLLEPEPIVVGRVLEELGRLLQHVLALPLLGAVLGLHVVLDRLATGCLWFRRRHGCRRGRRRRWRDRLGDGRHGLGRRWGQRRLVVTGGRGLGRPGLSGWWRVVLPLLPGGVRAFLLGPLPRRVGVGAQVRLGVRGRRTIVE